MKIQVKDIDIVVWAMLLPVLLIDSLNGILYENNISTPFSVSQIYKLGIVGLFMLRLVKTPKYIWYTLSLLGLMSMPSILQLIKGNIEGKSIIQDVIFSFKYLIVLISFFYFKVVLSTVNKYEIPKYFVWIKLSYILLAINLSLKLVGLGYPMYDNENIGSRGFFIAGNEISALLLILSGIMAYYYWVVNKNIRLFVIYGLVSFILGLLISSKTGMLGIVLIHALIILSTINFDLKDKRALKRLFYAIGVVLIFFLGIALFVQNSAIMHRYMYFWHKMDFVTFILSSRNVYLAEMLPVFDVSYSSIEKGVGVGITRFEALANQKIEIDILDILFTYGYLGTFLFCGLLILYVLNALKLVKKSATFIYAKLSLMIFVLLLLLSCLSGHIFNSGIAGIFVGFVMSLGYYKKIDG